MNNNVLIGAIQEELKRIELDPIRNARLRVVADANGRFREIVEEMQ
jgi:hypothetical protein